MNESMTVRQTIKTLRILLVAMLWGLVAFLALTVLVLRDAERTAEPRHFFFIALAALVVGAVIAYVVLRRVWAGQLRRRFAGRQVEEDEPLIVRSFFTTGLVGAAFTEGSSFFGAVIYWVDNDRAGLFVACLGVLLLLAQWPTLERYRTYFERVTGQRPV